MGALEYVPASADIKNIDDNINVKEMLEAGNKMGNKGRRCKDIISEVETAISGFSVIAEQVHIKEKTYEYINSIITETKVLQ